MFQLPEALPMANEPKTTPVLFPVTLLRPGAMLAFLLEPSDKPS